MSAHDTTSHAAGDAERLPNISTETKAPLFGVLFAVVFTVGFLVSGDVPARDAAGAEIVEHYDDAVRIQLGVAALLVAATAFLFFAGALHRHLRATGAEWLATVAFGGAVAYSLGLGLFAMTQFTLLDAADLGEPEVAQALNIIDNNNFPPIVVALATVLLATGWHALASGSLPRWLGAASMILGLVALGGPAGIVAFMLFPLWVVAVAVALLRRSATLDGREAAAFSMEPATL